jgi:hypothetical protein
MTTDLDTSALNIAMAERVMGWHKHYRDSWLCPAGASPQGSPPTPEEYLRCGCTRIFDWEDADGDYVRNGNFSLGFGEDDPEWSPLTSVADAWQVVEAMQAKGWLPRLSIIDGALSVPEVAGQWYVAFSRPSAFQAAAGGIIMSTPAYAPTMPLAVCQAALAAVGGRT